MFDILSLLNFCNIYDFNYKKEYDNLIGFTGRKKYKFLTSIS